MLDPTISRKDWENILTEMEQLLVRYDLPLVQQISKPVDFLGTILQEPTGTLAFIGIEVEEAAPKTGPVPPEYNRLPSDTLCRITIEAGKILANHGVPHTYYRETLNSLRHDLKHFLEEYGIFFEEFGGRVDWQAFLAEYGLSFPE